MCSEQLTSTPWIWSYDIKTAMFFLTSIITRCTLTRKDINVALWFTLSNKNVKDINRKWVVNECRRNVYVLPWLSWRGIKFCFINDTKSLWLGIFIVHLLVPAEIAIITEVVYKDTSQSYCIPNSIHEFHFAKSAITKNNFTRSFILCR